MSLLPQYEFPTLFSISSQENKKGILLTFDSPVGVGNQELQNAPNMADLLNVLPGLEVSGVIHMFAKSLALPRVFTFSAEPHEGHAKVTLKVTHPTKGVQIWSKDFSKENISVKDLIGFADVLKEGVAYQKS